MAESFEFDVFLSHNSVDKPEVELVANLLAQGGIRPFLDKWEIVPGTEWLPALESALERSETAAIFYGPNGAGPWQEAEIQVVLDRNVRKRGDFRVIPVVLPGGNPDDMSSFCRRSAWVDFRNGLDGVDSLNRLVCGIKGQVPVSAQQYELPDEPAPYRGLERFESEQSDRFYGRNEEIRRMALHLRDHPFLAIVGASGCGKSSLVRSGLVPSKVKEIVPELETWARVTVVPGERPLQALAIQMARLWGHRGAELSNAVEQLAGKLYGKPEGLAEQIQIQYASVDQPFVLVVDQFEEVYTQASDEDAQAFTDALTCALALGVHQFRLLITIRADFLGQCIAHPQLLSYVESNQIMLGGLSEEAIREVIALPARDVGAFLEKGLVERILNDVTRDRRGYLPLLQQALSELWRARQGHWLTNDAYDASGGVRQALQRSAQRVYGELSPTQRELADGIFLRLTTLGTGTVDTRRRVARQELYPADVPRDEVDAVIHELSQRDARILVVDEDSIEFTHEAIFLEWDHLRDLLNNERDAIHRHRQIGEAAKEWAQQEKKDAYLLRAGRLEMAERWQTAGGNKMLNALEWEFLGTSLKLRARERARKVRWQTGSMLFLVAIAVVLSFLLIETRKARQIAETSTKLAEIRGQAEEVKNLCLNDPPKALRLAIETAHDEDAFRTGRSVPVYSSLMHVVEFARERGKVHVPGETTEAKAISISPDGKFVLSFQEGFIQLYNQTNDLQAILYAGGHLVGTAAGKDTAAVAQVNTVKFAKYLTKQGPRTPSVAEHSAEIVAVRYAAQVNRFYSVGRKGDIFVWDPDGQTVLEKIQSTADDVADLVVTRDGTGIAVLNGTGANPRTSIHVLSASHGQWETIDDQGDRFLSIASDPSFGMVWAATGNRVLKAWDFHGEDRVAGFPTGHDDRIVSLAISESGLLIATGSMDRTARVFDREGRAVFPPLRGHQMALRDVEFAPGDECLITAGGDSTIRSWDLNGTVVAQTMRDSAILSLVLEPDKSLLAVSEVDGDFSILDSTDLAEVYRVQLGRQFEALFVLPKSRNIVGAERVRGEIHLVDWTGKPVADPLKLDPNVQLRAIWVDAEEDLIYVLHRTSAISILDGKTLQVVEKIILPDQIRNSVKGGLCVIGKTAYITSRHSLFRYDLSKKVLEKSVHEIGSFGDEPRGIAVSGDHQWLATGSTEDSQYVAIYQAKDLQKVREIDFGTSSAILGLNFLPSGHLAGFFKDGNIRIVTLEGSPVGPPIHGNHSMAWNCTIHPEESVLVSGGNDQVIRLISLEESRYFKLASDLQRAASSGTLVKRLGHSFVASEIFRDNLKSEAGALRANVDEGVTINLPDGWTPIPKGVIVFLQNSVKGLLGDEQDRYVITGAYYSPEGKNLNLIGPGRLYGFQVTDIAARDAPVRTMLRVRSSLMKRYKDIPQLQILDAETGDFVWSSELGMYVIDFQVKFTDRSYLGGRAYLLPAKDNLRVFVAHGDAKFVEQTDAIMAALEIDEAIKPDAAYLAGAEAALQAEVLREKEIKLRETRMYDDKIAIAKLLDRAKDNEADKLTVTLPAAQSALEIGNRYYQGAQTETDWIPLRFGAVRWTGIRLRQAGKMAEAKALISQGLSDCEVIRQGGNTSVELGVAFGQLYCEMAAIAEDEKLPQEELGWMTKEAKTYAELAAIPDMRDRRYAFREAYLYHKLSARYVLLDDKKTASELVEKSVHAFGALTNSQITADFVLKYCNAIDTRRLLAEAATDHSLIRDCYARSIGMMQIVPGLKDGRFWRNRLAQEYGKQGSYLVTQGDSAGARTAYEGALRIADELVKDDMMEEPTTKELGHWKKAIKGL